MIDQHLVHMIENAAPAIAVQWTSEILTCPFTPTYRKFSEKELNERSRTVYENLGKWLDMDSSNQEISREYSILGRKRYQEGFSLSEVLYALHVTKKILWRHVNSTGILKSALEMYRTMDIVVRLFHFYDLAAFFICRGYQGELFRAVKESQPDSGPILANLFRISEGVETGPMDRPATRNWMESWNLFKTK